MAADDEAAKNTADEMETQITQAMKNKLKDFKEQADSLTLEGVRRALEKDLGLKTYSLDAHKRFIKKCLEKYFYGADDENGSTSLEVDASQSVKEHKSIDDQPQVEMGTSKVDIDKEQEVSPSSAEKESACPVTNESKLSEQETDLSEDTIKEALNERAAYLRANLEHISLAKVRRMLEEDLKLKVKALDAFKNFIAEEVDLILQSSEVFDSANGVKKTKRPIQDLEKSKPVKKSKGSHKESNSSDINDASSSEDDIDEKKRSKKRTAPKIKASEASLKRQKKSTNKTPDPKKKKLVEQESEKSSAEEAGNFSEDDHSHSSQEVKKKLEKPAPVYSKKVEHLKSVIKSCGMGVPPSVYRRAKQAPESEREAFLVKELEEILEKEGLSTNPSEKEIKSARKRKERAKELEGIDMSNIVTTSRRRSTSSYIPPPKPKIELESDEDEEEDEEDDEEDNEENSDDGDNNDAESSEGSERGVEDESE